jgi:hypothetical protein
LTIFTGPTGVGGTGASTFNQCGVAAPLPADTGQCTVVSVPLITNFDDYAGSNASDYPYYVNDKPPAENALLGGILHVDVDIDVGVDPVDLGDRPFDGDRLFDVEGTRDAVVSKRRIGGHRGRKHHQRANP